MNFIYFVLGALSLAVGFIVQPYVKMGWQWLKSLIPHRKNTYTMGDDVEHLKEIVKENSKHIVELEQQINNVAEALSTRDKNRKYNTRREIREYLEELRTK